MRTWLRRALWILALTATLPLYGFGPLRCGDGSVMVKGGGSPTLFTREGTILLIDPTTTPSIFVDSKLPSFNRHFNVPWTIGAELAFNLSSRVQLFFEYACFHADGKKFHHRFDGFVVDELFFAYQSSNGYLGLRYYFDCWCLPCAGSPIAPFIGFKTGIAVQSHINHTLFLDEVFLATNNYFRAQVGVSGALLAGVEWWFAGRLSFLFQVECLLTQGLRSNKKGIYTPALPGGVVNESVGTTGMLLSFPFTLGLRYTF